MDQHWNDDLSLAVDGVEYVRRDEYDNAIGHRDRVVGERDEARALLREARGWVKAGVENTGVTWARDLLKRIDVALSPDARS